MAITIQARQADGSWATRTAFIDDNKRVQAGSMKAEDLEWKARGLLRKWQTLDDGKQLRVHNSDNDPKPQFRRPSDKAKLHHVYVDAIDGAAVVTPDFSDAQRAFDAFTREYPGDEVTWDRVDDFDPELGAFGSVRVKQSVPAQVA
ncbi:MAG: hypothetical protein ABFD89_18595 [Bryobacteraceae bacterium]